jgi:hypothetical protein
MLSLKGLGTVLHRAQALELCRDSFVVVPPDVLVQRCFKCVSVEESDVVEEFFLEVAKEIAFAGHGLDGAGALEEIPPRGVTVLEALVRMHERLLTRFQGKSGPHATKCWSEPGSGMCRWCGDDLPVEEVHDRGEVELAVSDTELRHVSDPLLVRGSGVGLLVQQVRCGRALLTLVGVVAFPPPADRAARASASASARFSSRLSSPG